MYEENITFGDIKYALKKRWKLIISSILLGTLLSIVATQYIVKPLYMVRSKIFIGSKDQNDEVHDFLSDDEEDEDPELAEEGDNNYGLMYQNLLDTYAEVLTSKDVVQEALDNCGIKITLEEALFGLSVEGKKETQILMISYTGNDRVQARDIVRALTNELLRISKDIIPNVDAKITQVASLPQSPIFPNKKMNVIVGMFLGSFIGIGLALLLELNNATYRNEEQIENILGVQVLGLIPDENKINEYDYYDF